MKIVLKKEESTLNCYLFYLLFWWIFGVQLQAGLYYFPQTYGVWADIIVSGITIIFIGFMRRNWLVSQLKNLKKNWKRKLFWIVFLAVLNHFACVLFSNFMYSMNFSLPENETALRLENQAGFLLRLLSTGIIAPILEELIYRGCIYEDIKKRFGGRIARIVSSIIFAVPHLFSTIIAGNYINLLWGICYFTAGYLFSIAYEKTGSVAGSALTHVLYNTCAVLQQL